MTLKVQDIETKYGELFGGEPEIVARAPGRVNLIGEHTDYNDGFVFPAAIERDVVVVASRRQDRQIRAVALNFNQSSTFDLDDIEPAGPGRERWSNYFRAMAFIFEKEGLPVLGLNCVAQGDVPLGAGLSSSAAMLVAVGLVLAASTGTKLDPVKLALMAQRAEREFVGVNVGIMDQFISANGQKDHALKIDTRDLSFEAVPLPRSGVSIVIADTNKKRGLVDSEYNTRRAECESAVAILSEKIEGVTALRDVSLENFNRFADLLPELPRKRAHHVITEDARTLEGVTALKAGNIARFGELMNASHESLKSDYEVSCTELDALVEASRSIEGVYGSRMTGAGFGGCTVSMVDDSAVERFQREVPRLYREATGLDATIYITTAAQGAQTLRG